MESFYQNSPIVEKVAQGDNPASILEISGYNCCYGKLFRDCLNQSGHSDCRLDRIIMGADAGGGADEVYDSIYPSDALKDIDALPEYDMIFVTHLFENTVPENALKLIRQLLDKVKQRILILTPEFPYDLTGEAEFSKVRAYTPETFAEFTAVFDMNETFEGNWQFYSVFNPEFLRGAI